MLEDKYLGINFLEPIPILHLYLTFMDPLTSPSSYEGYIYLGQKIVVGARTENLHTVFKGKKLQ